MMNNQKIGGITALLQALLYLIGFGVLFTLMSPIINEELSATDKLEFILSNKLTFQIWHLLIYVVFGVFLIPLAIAIQAHFKQTQMTTKVATVLAFLWAGLVIASGMIINVGIEAIEQMFAQQPAAALASWETLKAVQDGLGGGVEVVGGLWVLLLSISGLKEKVFPKALNYLGLIVGLAGVLTIIPALKDLGALFGLSQIVWFAWLGVYLLKTKP